MAEYSTVSPSAVQPGEPARQVVATFENYPDAEDSVDYLSGRRFQVTGWPIVGALLVHALQRGQCDFHSISGLRPKYYDVVVEVADRALRLLAGGNRKE